MHPNFWIDKSYFRCDDQIMTVASKFMDAITKENFSHFYECGILETDLTFYNINIDIGKELT